MSRIARGPSSVDNFGCSKRRSYWKIEGPSQCSVGLWVAFQQKAVNVYSDLDFNFDLPSDEEVEESFSANYSQEPGTPVEAHSPSSSSVPPADA